MVSKSGSNAGLCGDPKWLRVSAVSIQKVLITDTDFLADASTNSDVVRNVDDDIGNVSNVLSFGSG